MKFLILILLTVRLEAKALSVPPCADFSGKWQGSCTPLDLNTGSAPLKPNGEPLLPYPYPGPNKFLEIQMEKCNAIKMSDYSIKIGTAEGAQDPKWAEVLNLRSLIGDESTVQYIRFFKWNQKMDKLEMRFSINQLVRKDMKNLIIVGQGEYYLESDELIHNTRKVQYSDSLKDTPIHEVEHKCRLKRAKE